MCCCLVAFIAWFAPRVALFILWVFTPYVSRAFHGGFIWPFLGLIFLPYTTLIYSVIWKPGIGVTGWAWVWVGLGVLLDLMSYGGGGASSRNRD